MITIEDAKVIAGATDVRTKTEIYCPNCGRDVDEGELAALKCNDCGTDLSAPEQHVAIVVASIPMGLTTLE
jgi:tRNA(Ile2) C34 agmatinyltransferase TiaS